MAKGLPYFQFEPSEWENGNIQMCTREEKGLFIDLCSIYWQRLGDLPYKLAVQKLCAGNASALQSLCDSGIFEEIDGNVFISFLNEQLQDRGATSKINSEAAKKRWLKHRADKESDASALRTQYENDANAMPIEENRIEENIIENNKKENKASPSQNKKFTKPELIDLENYFLETFGNANEASKFQNYYESNGWKVGRNQMKDWKAAARNWIANSKNFNNSTQNGKQQLTKSELEQQKFNERYGTNFGNY